MNNLKDYLVLTLRTQDGKELSKTWSVVSSPRNPLGEGFNQLTSPLIVNKIIESHLIEELLDIKFRMEGLEK